MSKYHVIMSNSDGKITSHLNLSLVGVFNIVFDKWINLLDDPSLSDKDPYLTDEDILFSIGKCWSDRPITCLKPDDYSYEVYISNNDELHPYDLNRLFESKKALLRWAKSQIKKKVSEKSNK